jgi:putative salt-induced outer membrane protein
VFGGIGTGRPACRGGDGSQGVVCAGKETVKWRQAAYIHGGNYRETAGSTGILRDLLQCLTGLIGSKGMKMRTLIVVAALAAPLSSLAQDAKEPASPWSGKATLGYLATSGNTENSTLNSGFEVGYTVNKWAHLFSAKAVNASDNNVTTAEAYDAGWKSERKISDHDFLYGRLDWRKDRFGGFDTQFAQTVGYGRRLIDTDKHKLNAEVGAGARQSEAQNGTETRETIATGGLYYKWLFSESAEFRQDVSVESGSDNTYLESVTAVKSTLIGDLALVASYTVKHNTDVPALTEKTDPYTALSLEYAF